MKCVFSDLTGFKCKRISTQENVTICSINPGVCVVDTSLGTTFNILEELKVVMWHKNTKT
ncbi:MAG: hypothetical protein LBJ79_02970 [Endomicrobium sp.]|jgi:hypothetical protein|nr:hypothetical protein [Endomicrobium sp.]